MSSKQDIDVIEDTDVYSDNDLTEEENKIKTAFYKNLEEHYGEEEKFRPKRDVSKIGIRAMKDLKKIKTINNNLEIMTEESIKNYMSYENEETLLWNLRGLNKKRSYLEDKKTEIYMAEKNLEKQIEKMKKALKTEVDLKIVKILEDVDIDIKFYKNIRGLF